jgi:hypothetical protein
VVVEGGEKSGTVHQVREALAIGRPVLVAEDLLRGPGVTWVRDIVGNPGVIVWATARDVIELLALACANIRCHRQLDVGTAPTMLRTGPTRATMDAWGMACVARREPRCSCYSHAAAPAER